MHQHWGTWTLLLGTILSSIFLIGQCDRIFVQEPAPGRSYEAGGTLLITWSIDTNSAQSESIDSIQLDVLTGPSENGVYVINIADGLSPGAGAYEWHIPTDFPSSSSYFVRITGNVGATGGATFGFSGRWGVRNGGEPLPTPTAQPMMTSTLALTSTRMSATSTRLRTITSGSSTLIMTSIETGAAAVGCFDLGVLAIFGIVAFI